MSFQLLQTLIDNGDFPKDTGFVDLEHIKGVYGNLEIGILLGCGETKGEIPVTITGTIDNIKGRCTCIQEDGNCSTLRNLTQLGRKKSVICPYSSIIEVPISNSEAA